jgi:hypothetical protein
MRCTLSYAQELTRTIYELGKFNVILIYTGISRLVAAKQEIAQQLLV